MQNIQEKIPFFNLLDSIYNSIVITNGKLDGPHNPQILYVNKGFERMTGYTQEEVIGKTPRILQGELTDRKVLDELKIKLNNKEYFEGDSTNYKKDGSFYNVQWNITPMLNDSGELDYFFCVQKDITKEKEYEAHLQRRVKEEIAKAKEFELFYNKIFQTANLGICLTNAKGNFVAVNSEYCNMYGYKEEELVGNHFTMISLPEHKEFLSELHDKFIFDKQFELTREWEVIRKDEEHLHVLATASLLEDVAGGPYKITTVSDLTQSYKTREFQKKQEALLIQQSKMASMGEMIGAIAHQWRQPLNALNLVIANIKDAHSFGKLDDIFLEKSVNKSNRLIQKMSSTIDDFRNFLKPEKSKVEFFLEDVVNDSISLLEGIFNSYDIDIHKEVQEGVKIFGYSNEFSQAVLNILNNAKDALIEKNILKKEIYVKIWHDKKYAYLSVEDTAKGIEEKIKEKIFEPYFTTKEHSNGTGIGLYVTNSIITEHMNGIIFVQNTQKGAKFTITLPMQ